MKTIKELCALIASLGIPWANGGFASGEEPEPPFIVLVAGFGAAFYADNAAHARWMPYDIALYTRRRDYATERRITAALDAAEIASTKTVTILESENLTEAAFSVNVTEDD